MRQAEAERIIIASLQFTEPGERISFLSRHFLGTPYQESTLVGGAHLAEKLIIDLDHVDCFTFLDYIEAMRLSRSFPEFESNLKKVRYRFGTVSFESRNHFFTDWAENNSEYVTDITSQAGSGLDFKREKELNKKEDGTSFVDGIANKSRKISYIPSDAVDRDVLGRIKNGDYAGIYSESPGLDVSHVGIVVIEGGTLYFRHASLFHRKVVDETLTNYIKGKPGIIVFRPKKKLP